MAMAALCRAEVARFDERDRPADWDGVVAAFESIGRPYAAAYARYRSAGATLRTRGSRARAEEMLADARVTAVRLGARPLLDAIDLLARQGRLDVADEPTAHGTGTTPTADLTERELEVLRLIAAGWSNQQIADALFISRKTASVHASHIFDKLGAANGVEAAAIAHRLGLVTPSAPPPDPD
jgi:DNA-binding NarL/FixJ family response regulator